MNDKKKSYNFILLRSKESIDQQASFFEELTEALKKDLSFSVHVGSTVEHTKSMISTELINFFICFIGGSKDLVQCVDLTHQMLDQIKNRKVVFVSINAIKNKKMEHLLKQKGFLKSFQKGQDVVEVTQWLPKVFSRLEQLKTEAKSNLNWLPPVEHEADCWLVKKSKDITRANRMWVLIIFGPGPSTGDWKPLSESNLDPDSEGKWYWSIKEKNKPDWLKFNGQWIYEGRKPQFIWNLSQWKFIGEKPHLYFELNSQILFDRFNTKLEGLEVHKNSKSAKTKVELIYNSFKKQNNDSTLEPGSNPFDSINFKIFIECKQPSKLGKSGFKVNATISEYSETDMVLIVDSNEFANKVQNKDEVKVEVEIFEGKKILERIPFIAEINEIQKMGPTQSLIGLSFNDSAKNELKVLDKVLDSRQDEVVTFLKTAKGL